MNEMKLVSIPDATSPNFGKLLALPGKKLRRIWAISPYYDNKSIGQLITYMDKQGSKEAELELIVVLDELQTRDDDELRTLDECIREKFSSCYSGIYLFPSGKLFHSKGYLVESLTDGKCAVGSLNLTQRGLTSNEELLAVFHYDKKSGSMARKFAEEFEAYVNKRWDALSLLPPIEAEKKEEFRNFLPSRAFFIAGKLYHDSNEAKPFSFKLHLPDAFRKSPNFSPIPELEAKLSDYLDMRKFLELKPDSRSSSHWKRYCLQTCYGYWGSDFHKKDIEEEREKKNRAEYYKETFCTLEKNYKELRCKLLERCEKVASEMKSDPNVGKKWTFLSEDGQDLDKDKLSNACESWFRRLMGKKEFIPRLCGYARPVNMPNVWEDEDAVRDFEDSFNESFNYELLRCKSHNVLFCRLSNDRSFKKEFNAWKKAIREGNQSAKNQ